MQRRSVSGFTLLELLVVVAIIAIIAAMATMSYFTAVDRARQKRTLNDMRTIASAWEARAADVNAYTAAGFTYPATNVTYDDLAAVLTPTYARSLPRVDGWKRPFQFAVGTGVKEYAIRSLGSDGTVDGGTITPGETTSADCDIIYANGAFITYPASVQSD